MIDVRAVVAAGALAMAFGAGWAANGWRVGAKVDAVRAEHSMAVAEAARLALNAQRALDDRRDALAQRLSEIEGAAAQRVKESNDETLRLRACIADGTCGLRIAATCPAPVRVVPGAPASGIMGSGAGARLTPAAERDYFALREGLARVQGKLAACQETLRAERVKTP